MFYPIEKYLSRLTDVLITITQEDYKLAFKNFYCKVEYMHGVGVNSERYYPVDEKEKNSLREKMGFTNSQKIILCIGELNSNKNQIMAIRMMHKVLEKYPDALLLLAGNGPKQQYLENFILSEKLQRNVKMIGYVTNLQDYQHIADAQVCCSKREGLPLNVIESMLSGNPVVATKNRGHRELIEDGKTGFLVNIDDYETMASKIISLFSNCVLKSCIERNALLFAQQYTFDSVKKELSRIYNLGR